MTGTILHVALAALAFVGGHFVMSSTPLRGLLVGAIGEGPFRGLYSLVAGAAIVWLVLAHGAAPFVALWGDPVWARHLAVVVMFFASILLFCGVSTPSPTAIGAKAPDGATPAPGILRVTRHPVMWAIGLWAVSHLIANGDAASAILFGSLGILALLGPRLMERRLRRERGAEWERVAAVTSNIPFAAALFGRTGISLRDIGYWRLIGGVALFAVLIGGHEWVIGLSPMPG